MDNLITVPSILRHTAATNDVSRHNAPAKSEDATAPEDRATKEDGKGTRRTINITTTTETEMSHFCPMEIQNICSWSKTKKIYVQMKAMPHTASSATTRYFERATKGWGGSSSLTKVLRNCPDSKRLVSICGGNRNSNTKEILRCVLAKLKFSPKQHQNMKRISEAGVTFTTLRDPAQLVLSHYRERKFWDRQWDHEYEPSSYRNMTVVDVNVTEWATKAWWRHNFFTKMLATDTRLIWTSAETNLLPTKEESDSENSLGENSTWLRTALDRLKSLPFFGLKHRMPDSFELMAFHLCLLSPAKSENAKNSRFDAKFVDPILENVIQKHFVLDSLLLREAEILFDDLVKDMRRKQEMGFLCEMGRALKQHPDVDLGLLCVD